MYAMGGQEVVAREGWRRQWQGGDGDQRKAMLGLVVI